MYEMHELDRQILLLIKTVNDNYSHIQELETLSYVLLPKFPNECDVCKTTQNSHYEYKLFTKDHKDPDNHVDRLLSQYYPDSSKYIKSYKDMYYETCK